MAHSLVMEMEVTAVKFTNEDKLNCYHHLFVGGSYIVQNVHYQVFLLCVNEKKTPS